MPVVGKQRSYHKKFAFAVEIDGLEIAWFNSISSLEGEVDIVEQREGGSILVADQSPGLLKHPPLSLKVGSTDNDELYNWWLQVADAEANGGEPDEQYKRNISIVEKERDGITVLRRWDLFQCWPNKFVAGEWDAGASENLMQEVSIVYKRFKLAA